MVLTTHAPFARKCFTWRWDVQDCRSRLTFPKRTDLRTMRPYLVAFVFLLAPVEENRFAYDVPPLTSLSLFFNFLLFIFFFCLIFLLLFSLALSLLSLISRFPLVNGNHQAHKHSRLMHMHTHIHTRSHTNSLSLCLSLSHSLNLSTSLARSLSLSSQGMLHAMKRLLICRQREREQQSKRVIWRPPKQWWDPKSLQPYVMQNCTA